MVITFSIITNSLFTVIQTRDDTYTKLLRVSLNKTYFHLKRLCQLSPLQAVLIALSIVSGMLITQNVRWCLISHFQVMVSTCTNTAYVHSLHQRHRLKLAETVTFLTTITETLDPDLGQNIDYPN
jgi:uncharacterized linocin/CFP29 family protein